MAELIEPELSYEIVGLCMKVHNELGRDEKEKHYQRALEVLFEKEGWSTSGYYAKRPTAISHIHRVNIHL